MCCRVSTASSMSISSERGSAYMVDWARVNLEAAYIPETELAVLDQTVFKGAAVEALEGDLPRLEQDNLFHIVQLPRCNLI